MSNGLTGRTLSGGGILGGPVTGSGGRVYFIERPPLPAVPSAGAVPAPGRGIINGSGQGRIAGPCGGPSFLPGSQAAADRGALKRPDYGPVVVVTSQTMPRGFKAGALAFGLVVPEGR